METSNKTFWNESLQNKKNSKKLEDFIFSNNEIFFKNYSIILNLISQTFLNLHIEMQAEKISKIFTKSISLINETEDMNNQKYIKKAQIFNCDIDEDEILKKKGLEKSISTDNLTDFSK